MAVAVKNTPETTSSGWLDRLPVASLVGALYLIASVGVVFFGVPQVLRSLFGQGTVPDIVTAVAMLAVGTVLAVFGYRLVSTSHMPGLRAGIFVCLVTLLVIALLTEWIGFLLEGWLYSGRWFGATDSTAGSIIAAVVGLGLLVLAVRWFLRPRFQRSLVRFEEQGWFSASTYKRNQGQRVRRGTILGILVLIGCGIFTLRSHNTLAMGEPDWKLSIPFTGRVTVTPKSVGDNLTLAAELEKDDVAHPELILNRFDLREKNLAFAASHVKIKDAGDAVGQVDDGQVVPKSEYEKAVADLNAREDKTLPTLDKLTDATGPISYTNITLLPAVRYSVLFLLSALTLWLAWRIVNVPAFADFLIATEAEVNKVSWTTRRRLIQDTIVVLVTVLLMAAFLLIADVVWSKGLQLIGVLHTPKDKPGVKAGTKELPW